MYLQRVQNVIKGYVYVVIEGFYIEKVINICRKNNINLTNVKRQKNTLMYANIPISEIKDVIQIVEDNNCKINIKQKKGLPFLLKKYRKRKIFAIALICVICCVVGLSKFVWNIEITGNVNISSNEILELVKREGLEVGKVKSKINLSNIVEKIRIEREDISWVRY